MGWLLSLSFLSVLFTCSTVAAQNDWYPGTNQWGVTTSNRNLGEKQLNGYSYGAGQSANVNPNINGQHNPDEQQFNGNGNRAGQHFPANRGEANNGQSNLYGYSTGNSNGAAQSTNVNPRPHLNDNGNGAEPNSTANVEETNNGPNEHSHENGAVQDSTGQTAYPTPRGRSHPVLSNRIPGWPVYNCRESIPNYDCVFRHVSIDRGSSDYYFGYENVMHNNKKSVTFKNSTMRWLPETLLNSFREVELLELSDLQIEEIEPNAFSNGINIQELYMSFNAIRELPTGVFSKLRSLSKLMLDRNYLERLPPYIFHYTRNISALSIANNNLERIEDNTFVSCKDLQYLILSSNKLTYIDLSRISSLHHGNVSSNLLTTLSIPEKVVELDASHNRINTVTGPLNLNLEVLLLQHNNLTDIAWLLRYSGLVTVDLSYNELEKVTHQHFRNMNGLKELYLSNNRLVALNLDQQPIRTLEVLDVRHNHLLYVENNQKQFNTLHQLYLDHNSIVTLKLSRFDTLQNLTLSHNDWDCSNLDQLFLNLPESVIGDSDRFCKSDYQLKQSFCCKQSDKPYLDRLIQHISLTSVAEKIQRGQGRCSATDAINTVQSLKDSMIKQGGGKLFQPNPQLDAEMNQLQRDIERLSNNQLQLDQRLEGMHNEIDNTLRRYRVTKEGLVQPSQNLRKVFEHLHNRRVFKEKETQTRQTEAERKQQAEETLKLQNEELQKQVDANKQKIIDIKKELKRQESHVKRLEAKKNNNAAARRVTK